MKRFRLVLALIAIIVLNGSCIAQNDSKVKWMSVSDAVSQANKYGKDAKMIFIDCYTSWCGWCKVLDQKTFSNDTIVAILNHYYYPCKFDAEGKEKIFMDGQTYNPSSKSGRGATHEFMKKIWYGQRGGGYPTMAILKTDFVLAECLMGYLPPNELEPYLIYYAEGYNKEIGFEAFKSQYESRYRKNIIKKLGI